MFSTADSHYLLTDIMTSVIRLFTQNAFGENSQLQNETGVYIGLESSYLRKLKILCYADFFHFFYRRYQVDRVIHPVLMVCFN